jgi:hypothetical protein
MTQTELKRFLKMLPYYEIHLLENKQSLLARMYGVYTIKMEAYAQNINIMLMANTLQFKEAAMIRHVFDIKGSKVKRDVEITDKTKNTTVLKDINLIRLLNKDSYMLNYLPGDVR